MTDSVSNAEIEDVLSSIRRLVSEDARPSKKAKKKGEMLVLTPALRVVDDMPASVEDSAEAPAETVVDERESLTGEQPQVDEVRDESVAEMLHSEIDEPQDAAAEEAPAAALDLPEDLTGDDFDLTGEAEEESPASAHQKLEQTIAGLEAAIGLQGGEWEPDGSEEQKTLLEDKPAAELLQPGWPPTRAQAHGTAEDEEADEHEAPADMDAAPEAVTDEEPHVEEVPAEEVKAARDMAEVDAPAEDAVVLDADDQGEPLHEAAAVEAALAEADAVEDAAEEAREEEDVLTSAAEEAEAPVDMAEDSPEAEPELAEADQPEAVDAADAAAPDAPEEIPAIEPIDVDLDLTSDAPAAERVTPEDVVELLDVARRPEAAQLGATPLINDKAEPDAAEDGPHEVLTADFGNRAGRRNAGQPPIAEDEEATYIDEEALYDMVSEIVRQELQGALGERITRNVRKLVRREIHRALSSRDFD